MNATAIPSLDPFIHELMWKVVPVIILCGIAALLLRESIEWAERRLTRAVHKHRAAIAEKHSSSQKFSLQSVASPICPACGSSMVILMARRGSNEDSKFWDCSRYLVCRGTRSAKALFPVLFGAVCILSTNLYSLSPRTTDPETFKTKAVFELAVHKSAFIKTGNSRLATESVFVSRTNKFFGGKVEALLIQFFTKPITEEAQADISQNDAGEMTRSDHATLVLFFDQRNRISQVNLTYVVPGTTVQRTVASTPEEIKKQFSDFQFDHERLRLKSNGSYSETESKDEDLSLSWNMDFDVPVFDAIKR